MRLNSGSGVLSLGIFAALIFSIPSVDAAEKKGKRVFFVAPKDGQTVKSPVKVKFGLKGMKVKPAGTLEAGTGHHHLIIDATPVAEKQIVPTDEKHIHFGMGQTETEVTLPPGEHTLTLQFADGSHLSYGPAMSATIKVKVKE